MDFEDKELCAWLENGLRTILESKAEHTCICSILPSGDVFTGYYNCCSTDKAMIAHNINSDAMLDVVLANIEQVKDALDDLEEESEGSGSE